MMRIVFMGCLFLSAVNLCASRPTICLNMTVKNEEQTIEASLESVKPWIDYWVIVDCESTDATRDLIQNALIDIPGELSIHPFVDLETSRNEALQIAKEKADYILYLDATERLLAPASFNLHSLNKEGYLFPIKKEENNEHVLRLIDSRLNWHWLGIANPELYSPEASQFAFMTDCYLEKVGEPLPFNIHLYSYEQLLSLQDLQLESSTACFLLAQIYRDADQPSQAFDYYKMRSEMGGDEEEIFWSLYQMAEIQEMLRFPQEQFIEGYIRAFNFRPSRVEPLYRLANYCRTHGNKAGGYQIANLALRLPSSQDKIPAVQWGQEWMRAYGLWFESMLCSYDLHLHEETINASQQLLNAPSIPIKRLANMFSTLEKERKLILFEGIFYNYNERR